ncbi:hypothetical protein C8Q80DRAFT_151027 [Daedaleopsis nitida]|nr:hypothetical protein C8Q80DRAFT_151027 [Daedaleopsis nitida]
MPTRAQGHISSTTSTATLDLQEILSSFAGDCLISIRLSLASSDSTHSFDDLAPFALPPTSSVTLTKQDMAPSALKIGDPPLRPCEPLATISCSTLKRNERPAPDSSYITSSRLETPNLSDGDCTQDITLVDPVSPSLPSAVASVSSCGFKAYSSNPPGQLLMPTIMVSNSTVALSVSLDSLHNLHHDASLAIRRGKQPPPTLSLAKLKQPESATADRDPYPDIPSAFLGSPTCHSPTFAFSSGNPSKFNMGLSAMCNSLKALVPPPPFSPTQSIPARTPKLQPEPRWGMVPSATLPAVDDDEWAFAQDLVVEWHASRGLRAEISPPPSPAGELPYVGDTAMSTPVEESTPPFSASTSTEPPTTNRADREIRSDVNTITKQIRRKTVIIQAPSAKGSDPQIGRPEKDDKVSACTGNRSIDLFPGDFDEPVPFEIPACTPAPAPASTDNPQVVSPYPRPTSTTSGRQPIRGILKEKKSVRFSSVPSMHEYENDDPHSDVEDADEHLYGHADIAPRPATPLPDPIAQNKHLQLVASSGDSRKRPTPTVTPRKSSPLRESHLPTSSDCKVAIPILTTHQAPSSSTTRPPTLLPRNTMAKHPAVRALACRPTAAAHSSPMQLSRDVAVGSGIGGAVVGAPELQPPTPIPLSLQAAAARAMPTSTQREDQRQASVKSINTRHSLPKDRKADVLISTKAKAAASSRDSQRPAMPTSTLPRDKENRPGNATAANVDRRVARAGTAPATTVPRHRREGDAHRRSNGVSSSSRDASAGAPVPPGAMQKGSRMPVPLRNIFTKMRT